ncbi:hypothetical protein [Serratia microhaemolytica]|uniref:hypothetical protein n=1 Tax=Serratia microhaemolytica TaxID=2675110 RepID=UPI000FDCEF2E|nr:hypothetical protein [Serratia microhaemolytica]
MPHISDKSYKKIFKGWLITDCIVINKNLAYLCLRKEVSAKKASMLWDSEIPSRLVAIHLDNLFSGDLSKDVYDVLEFEGMYKPKLGVTFSPMTQTLLASSNLDEDGSVLVQGADEDFSIEYIDKENYPGVKKIKCINEFAYAVGLHRSVYKRTNIDHWIKLTREVAKSDNNSDIGFYDLDGFHEKDMYAVGGKGDIWHYDGNIWSQCGFPSNEKLSTVICAPDGQVYIGGHGGNIWAGRQHSWQCIYQGKEKLWNEMRWFQDQLWLCSDYALKKWNGKELVDPEYSDEDAVLIELGIKSGPCGHMDARDGILLVADLNSVDLFDGKTWHSIV